MSEYVSVYKCRLCGKTFKSIPASLGRAAGIIGRLTNESSFAQGDIHGSRYAIHNCKDDSFGFADFQGFKRVSESL